MALTGVRQRLTRNTLPFADHPSFKAKISALDAALDAADAALTSVKPTDPMTEPEGSYVYIGIEASLRVVQDAIAKLQGAMEKKSAKMGDSDGNL